MKSYVMCQDIFLLEERAKPWTRLPADVHDQSIAIVRSCWMQHFRLQLTEYAE